jgi:hypothetical protein
MEETISESIAEEELESWIADGKYLDYADMEDKYKNKPDQLKSIFANTKTHFCKVRNCKLYEDPEYMSRRSSTLVTKNESKRQASAEKISKAAKVPKVVVQDDDAEISACQVKLLGKEKDQLRLMHTMLSALKAEADLERLKAAIAPPILTKLKLAIGNLDGQAKLIELTLENKKGDVASIVSENKAAKTEAIATAKLMRAQLVVAKSLAPPLDADWGFAHKRRCVWGSAHEKLALPIRGITSEVLPMSSYEALPLWVGMMLCLYEYAHIRVV